MREGIGLRWMGLILSTACLSLATNSHHPHPDSSDTTLKVGAADVSTPELSPGWLRLTSHCPVTCWQLCKDLTRR